MEEVVKVKEQSTPSGCNAAGCSKTAKKWCAQCHAVKYCSRECQLLDWKAGHKAVCSVKREEREHPFYHSHAKAATLQLVRGKDPIAALIADHEAGIKEVGDTVAALQSGNAAIIEIPERIGKRGTPTYSV
eukprot:11681-Heterococcus_DN1.PRE.1